jgi:hypothetical protein
MRVGTPMMRDPVWVYDNWSAYAEGLPGLTDIPLTEALALKQLEQVVRLKGLGVHFDYYLMNAFWFAPEGAYREWRKPHWPQGPGEPLTIRYSLLIEEPAQLQGEVYSVEY